MVASGAGRPGPAALPGPALLHALPLPRRGRGAGARRPWSSRPRSSTRLFAEVCGAVGEGLTARGDMDAALSLADRALSGLTEVDDERRMYPLRVAGMVALYVGRLDDGFASTARCSAWHGCTTALRGGDGAARAGPVVHLRRRPGPRPGVRRRTAARGASRLRNPSMLALAWYDQAEALSNLDPARPLEPYQRAVHLAESAGSTFVEGIALVGLASLLGRSQEPAASPSRCSGPSSIAGVG